MNGIFPDYVGPSLSYRFASLYPDYVGFFDVVVIDESPRGSGGSGRTGGSSRLRKDREEIMAVILAASLRRDYGGTRGNDNE